MSDEYDLNERKELFKRLKLVTEEELGLLAGYAPHELREAFVRSGKDRPEPIIVFDITSDNMFAVYEETDILRWLKSER